MFTVDVKQQYNKYNIPYDSTPFHVLNYADPSQYCSKFMYNFAKRNNFYWQRDFVCLVLFFSLLVQERRKSNIVTTCHPCIYVGIGILVRFAL